MAVHVITTAAAADLASRVAVRLDSPLERLETVTYPNGQIEVVPPAGAHGGAEVCLFHTFPDRVNDRLVELALALNAVSAQRPGRLIAVLPYMPYSRSDRPLVPGAPVPLRLIAEIIERAGATSIVTVEPHSAQLTSVFGCPVMEVSTAPLFARELRRLDIGQPVVICPDLGGAKRAERLAAELHAPIAVMRKRRLAGSKESFELLGAVAGRPAVLIDDEINSGETLLSACKLATRHDATDVYAVVAHGLFTPATLTRLAASTLRRLFVTDSVASSRPNSEKIEIVDLDIVLSEALGN